MNTIQILLTSIISAIIGILTALITTTYKMKKQQYFEKQKEKSRIRLKYLNPLLVASLDYLERMIDIKKRRQVEEKKNKMVQWFLEIKINKRMDKKSFEYWANDEGYFAISTLYVTAVYFFYASQIRRELPFIELSPGDDKTLLEHISYVRTSIGGKYGIWETIQDSLGAYLLDNRNETVINYRQFCDLIIDQTEYVWFNRLIDFYRDINKKTEDHINKIISSLQSLIEFLNKSMDL